MAQDASQHLVLLPGSFAIEHHPPGAERPEASWLSVVRAPDGMTVIREAAAEENDLWAALFSGGSPHAPSATGMLSGLLVPLARASVPVFVSSTYSADVVLVPRARLDEAIGALRGAGHQVDPEDAAE